ASARCQPRCGRSPMSRNTSQSRTACLSSWKKGGVSPAPVSSVLRVDQIASEIVAGCNGHVCRGSADDNAAFRFKQIRTTEQSDRFHGTLEVVVTSRIDTEAVDKAVDRGVHA